MTCVGSKSVRVETMSKIKQNLCVFQALIRNHFAVKMFFFMYSTLMFNDISECGLTRINVPCEASTGGIISTFANTNSEPFLETQ